MYQLIILSEERLLKLVQINRDMGTFRLKVNVDPGPGPRKGRHWLALYLQAPVKSTIPVNDDRVIHQNWELIEPVTGIDPETGEDLWLYKFEFMGFQEHDTFQYNGRAIGISAGVFHRILKEEADANPPIAHQLNDTAGLEHLQLTWMPHIKGFGVTLLANSDNSE